MGHYIYDLEVFKYGWLASFKDIHTGEFYDFIGTPERTEVDDLRAFIDEDTLLCGFNNKHYDNYILKAMYYGFDVPEIKELNDWIIGGNQGGEWPKWNRHRQPFKAYDIRDDLPMTLSLKEIEGNMGLPIVESSVPFDIDRPLNESEWNEVVEYCHFDINATHKLWEKRTDYLASKAYVGQLAGMTQEDALSMTNAKLTAAYLVGPNAKARTWDDETEYTKPKNVKVKNRKVLQFFKEIDPEYQKREVVQIAGVEHTLAYGGLHGAIPNYQGKSDEHTELINIDVVSYYPNLMIKNGYVSRAVPDPEAFERVVAERIEAKKAGDKAKANALKLVVNTAYGAMNNKYNPLYDPLMANSVCISGQLYLIDLIEKLEAMPEFKLIQSNTDGILISAPRAHRAEVDAIIDEWMKRTKFEMEYTSVDAIWQKDVNNYIMIEDGGQIKVKGAYVGNYEGGSIINASIPVVAKAIVDYLLYGITPEETIRNEKDMWSFQFIAKTGRSYDKTIWRNGDRDDIHEVQRVNRVYASLDSDHGTIYKVKEEEKRKDKIANLPDRCNIDNNNDLKEAANGEYEGHPISTLIDLEFYIDMAKKRIKDFIGDTPMEYKRKKEESEMTTKTTAEKQTPKALNLAQKIFELRKIMATFVWEKDGKNMQQSYKYITEAQYKKYFEQALETVGLDYSFDIDEVMFQTNLTEKMHLTTIKVRILLIEPETGEIRSYTAYGTGTDTGDKGLYKAQTGALKYFIATNFLVAENNDPEGDDAPQKPKSNRPATPEKRKEVKEELMKEEPATPAQKAKVKELRDIIKAGGKHAEVVKKINDTMKAGPSKVECNKLIMDIEEIAEEILPM